MSTTSLGVRDLARELGISDRDLVAKASANGIVISTISRLDAGQAERIRRMFASSRPSATAPTTRPVEKPGAATTPVGTVVRRRIPMRGEGEAPVEPVREAAPPPVAPAAPPPVAVAAPVVAAEVAPPAPVAPVAPAVPAYVPGYRDDRPRLRKARVEDLMPAPEAPIAAPTPAPIVQEAPSAPEAVAVAETAPAVAVAPPAETVAVAAPAPVATEVAAPVAAPAPVPVSAVPAQPEPIAAAPEAAPAVEAARRDLGINQIGAAIRRDEAPSTSKVPRLIRTKMPEYLVNIPKPTPRPVVEEKPAAPAPAATTEAAADRGGIAPRHQPVEDLKGGRGRKVIYDRRRDSLTATDSRARGKKKGKAGKMVAVQSPLASALKRTLKIEDTVTVANLAHLMSAKSNDVIKKLFELGIMATVNHSLDLETAELIAGEFGFTVENVGFDLESFLQKPDDAKGEEAVRPPVVTVMGHVDHGKTSLLDAIRKTHTATREAGGITQHIGAYVAEVASEDGRTRKVVFLDTPGHEAFSAMRARGAKATDVIVLVVAADDGVMPQTIEAINHGKAAKVPMLVAVNKIDKPGADVEKVRRELAEHGIMAEEWGGDTIFCEVSAKTGKGLDKLLEMLALQSEVLDLKANPDADARGLVIESRLERGRGPVATLLVQGGTLKKGQYIVAGSQYCRVRAMQDDAGRPIDTAGPSTPVEVIGFETVTNAGDEFYVVADEKKAKTIVEHRVEKQREKDQLKTSKRTLEDMFASKAGSETKDLNLIIKADVHGSAEALKQALTKIEHEEVKVRVLHAAVGGVTESDIHLASASKAVIIAFNVKPEAKGKRLADDLNVPIKQYSVIYDAIDEVTVLLEGMLTPIIEEHILGHAEVRELFSVPKLGTIAGCSVQDGIIQRSARMRLFRGKDMMWEGEIASLRRFKDDVKEVSFGYECGIGLVGFAKMLAGDRLECFELKKIARKLPPVPVPGRQIPATQAS